MRLGTHVYIVCAALISDLKCPCVCIFERSREDEEGDDDGLSLDEFFESYEAERAVRRKRYANSPKIRQMEQAGACLADLPPTIVEHERRQLLWNITGEDSSPKGLLPEGLPPTINQFAYHHMWDPQSTYEETEAEIAARKLLEVEAAA